MKNILYTIILSFLFSSVCLAEWTYLAAYPSGEDNTVYAYYDKSRIKRTGGSIYVWELKNNKKIINEFGIRSIIFYNEYECEIGRFRILTTNYYKGPMGANQIDLAYQAPKDWMYPGPNSDAEKIMKIFCS